MSKAAIQTLAQRFPDAVQDAYEGVGGDDCAFVAKDRIQKKQGHNQLRILADSEPVRRQRG